MLPEWAQIGIGFLITSIFVLALLGMAGSPYGDWVRNFYAKRDRLTTLSLKEEREEKKR